MTTITEDYVSFEIAKLLKEKGFDVYGDGSFGSEIKIWMEYSPFGKIKDVSSSRPSIKSYPAPTLQMAMKWLREVHNLFVDIYYDYDFREGYKFSIHKLTKGTTLETNNENYSTYEQACDKAIKYCLENLM